MRVDVGGRSPLTGVTIGGASVSSMWPQHQLGGVLLAGLLRWKLAPDGADRRQTKSEDDWQVAGVMAMARGFKGLEGKGEAQYSTAAQVGEALVRYSNALFLCFLPLPFFEFASATPAWGWGITHRITTRLDFS